MFRRTFVSDDVEKNKAAIILLSTAANVISRHTSMVGVDRTRPEKVTGDMMQRRVPMMQDPTLRYGGGMPKGAMMCAVSHSLILLISLSTIS